MPKTQVDFWSAKFHANCERDVRNEAALRALGWKVVTVWECETKSMEALRERLSMAFDLTEDSTIMDL